MGLFGIISIGIALSMDVAAVSMVNGMVDRRLHGKKAILCSLSFGLFQGLFSLIGYWAGTVFFDIIAGYDHYIALILLSYIGGKMCFESFKKEKKTESCLIDRKKIVLQSVATSIDALAVGVSLVVLQVDIVLASLVIALCSFLVGIVSINIGKRFGARCSNKTELIGGIILILIGLNIFMTHVIG
jgi:putative Mn2+ efflux pump MntP